MAQGIWIIAELQNNALSSSTHELFTPARRLADKSSQALSAILVTGESDVSQAEAQLGHLGADQVITVRHDLLKTYQAQLFTIAIADLIKEKQPNIVLFAASTTGVDIAPRIAIRTEAGLVTQAIDLDLNEAGQLEVTRTRYAESLLSMVITPEARPQMATVKKKAFPAPVLDTSHNAPVEVVTPKLDAAMAKSSLKEIKQAEGSSKKKLEEADVIVSGGRGMKGPENFNLVEELAAALNGAVGASRAVVDAGWRPHSEQVGQTGKTVNPKLYVALGISGALQHLVGMSSSQTIVAINRDENAPIFKVADIGVVGDALEITPLLTQAIQEQHATVNV
ncbi:MAG: electron transfer flavoprotein subunit alpha/FixB family protein [Vampirovibrionales bacterium]|nr:electron transfer flavoprotein subunit alpha/FixB family protein [Vampirovibrionales bacterium]